MTNYIETQLRKMNLSDEQIDYLVHDQEFLKFLFSFSTAEKLADLLLTYSTSNQSVVTSLVNALHAHLPAIIGEKEGHPKDYVEQGYTQEDLIFSARILHLLATSRNEEIQSEIHAIGPKRAQHLDTVFSAIFTEYAFQFWGDAYKKRFNKAMKKKSKKKKK